MVSDESCLEKRSQEVCVVFSVSHSMRFVCFMRFSRFKRHREPSQRMAPQLLCMRVCVLKLWD